ncbi:hydrogenase nickel incorporation protein HypB [Rugosimonospora acidiphila]|uniref:Hydrogenase nickel incorporation protein HypB n=1 Tax=Rugosimonospora acidiphila TaxID=556531 RepID=A0ABP9SHT6_9ACTN
MCGTCGCAAPTTIALEQRVLEKNDLLAERNREWFARRHILAVNLMSSPGSGKTTLLERTVRAMAERAPVFVIEGDQATGLDSGRIRAAGARALQINTGAGCHLDAAMVARGLRELDPPEGSLLFVENVGNLVCPALFDLGESARVVVASVTEGADKPLKYPHMFRCADLLLLNKVDLLPHLDVDLAAFERAAASVRPGLVPLPVSATRGDGLESWYGWLRARAPRSSAPGEVRGGLLAQPGMRAVHRG